MDAHPLKHAAFITVRKTDQPPTSSFSKSGTDAAANDSSVSGNNALSVEAAIDDWLGPDVASNLGAAVHAAFHGVVSAPFLLLDHAAMTPELVQAMPVGLWSALAKAGNEQGCSINSVCLPERMTACPRGLAQFGALAYIELPDFAGNDIDLRTLKLEPTLHLSLRGSSNAATIHARIQDSITVTGNKNAVTVHYCDESSKIRKTEYLDRLVHPSLPGTLEVFSSPIAGVIAAIVVTGPAFLPSSTTDAPALTKKNGIESSGEAILLPAGDPPPPPCDFDPFAPPGAGLLPASDDNPLLHLHAAPLPAGDCDEPASSTDEASSSSDSETSVEMDSSVQNRSASILEPLRRLLTMPVGDEKKFNLVTRTSPAALTGIVDAVMHKDAQVLRACFDYLAWDDLSNNLQFRIFAFILKSVWKRLRGTCEIASYVKVAPFVVGQLLETRLRDAVKFRLLDENSPGGRMGLTSALKRNAHVSITLIIEALAASSLPVDKMVAMLKFDDKNNPFQFAAECGYMESVSAFTNAVLGSAKLASQGRLIFQHCRPITFSTRFVEPGNVERAIVTFAISALKSKAPVFEIEFLTGLHTGDPVVGGQRFQDLAQAFYHIVCVADQERIVQYITAVYQANLSDSSKTRLLVEGRMRPVREGPRGVLSPCYVKGWTMFMEALFFSGFSSDMKFALIKQSKSTWESGVDYHELFLQVAMPPAESPDTELSELREAVLIELGLPKSVEGHSARALEKIVDFLKNALDCSALSARRKTSLLRATLRSGLASPKTCLTFTKLILDAALDDLSKVDFFRGADAKTSGLAQELHQHAEIRVSYLRLIIQSSLANTSKVTLLGMSDWSTNQKVMRDFVEQILGPTLDNESVMAIMLDQTATGNLYDQPPGITLLECVLKSRLSNSQKTRIAGDGGRRSENMALGNIHEMWSLQAYLQLVLESTLEVGQIVHLCKAENSLGCSYLYQLFECIAIQARNDAALNYTPYPMHKALDYMQAVLQSKLPDAAKLDLLSAVNKQGVSAIEHAVRCGAGSAAELYTYVIESSKLPAAMKQQLVRKGNCLIQ